MNGYQSLDHRPRERPAPSVRPDWIPRTHRGLSGAVVGFVLLLLLSWSQKGELTDLAGVRPELRQAPVQEPTARSELSFVFAGETYRVRPVAEYELWGLVVSHNNPQGFGDIYHDDTSVDTRDFCVIWGANLETADFREVDFSSVSFTCYWQHGPGVRFAPNAIGNNHLITDDPRIRDLIATVRVGDQVHLSGLLVDYQAASQPRFWRETSTIREDDGPGACEVVFVENLEILERGTPLWYAAFGAAWWLLGLALLAKVALFIFETRRRYLDGPASPPIGAG